VYIFKYMQLYYNRINCTDLKTITLKLLSFLFVYSCFEALMLEDGVVFWRASRR